MDVGRCKESEDSFKEKSLWDQTSSFSPVQLIAWAPLSRFKWVFFVDASLCSSQVSLSII